MRTEIDLNKSEIDLIKKCEHFLIANLDIDLIKTYEHFLIANLDLRLVPSWINLVWMVVHFSAQSFA